MSTHRYDIAVFIGRFQPLHEGHISVMRHALSLADHVLILVGSVNGARTFKNPFTFEQRRNTILQSIEEGEIQVAPDQSMDVCPIRDAQYNNMAWIESVQDEVKNFSKALGLESPSVALVGHQKDASSVYLTWFPQWIQEPAPVDEKSQVVDATAVRNLLFEGMNEGFFKGVLPAASFRMLRDFKTLPIYEEMKAEYNYIRDYKKTWESAPHAPIFVCADVVLICAGHVALVRRPDFPGKGLWSVPGHFLRTNELIQDCAIRSLVDKTQIEVEDSQVFKHSIRHLQVFESPGRSFRGRTISHSFLMELPVGPQDKLPVLGSKEARWVPLSEVEENQMFEDHFAIIRVMTKALW